MFNAHNTRFRSAHPVHISLTQLGKCQKLKNPDSNPLPMSELTGQTGASIIAFNASYIVLHYIVHQQYEGLLEGPRLAQFRREFCFALVKGRTQF